MNSSLDWQCVNNCCSQKIKLFSIVNVVAVSQRPQSMLSFSFSLSLSFSLSFIDNAKLLHSARALSVSDRLRPLSASFGRIRPFPSICSYRSMPYCSAMYLTATGGSSLSRGLTPSMASSSLWRESHLCRVFIDTPAAWASSLLVMDFMIRYLMFIYWGVIMGSHNFPS